LPGAKRGASLVHRRPVQASPEVGELDSTSEMKNQYSFQSSLYYVLGIFGEDLNVHCKEFEKRDGPTDTTDRL